MSEQIGGRHLRLPVHRPAWGNPLRVHSAAKVTSRDDRRHWLQLPELFLWRCHCINLLPATKVHNMGMSGINGPRDSAATQATAPQKRSVATTQATTVLPFTGPGGSSSPLARRCCNSFQACQPRGIKITRVSPRMIIAAKKEDAPAISSGMRPNGPRRKSNKNSQK